MLITMITLFPDHRDEERRRRRGGRGAGGGALLWPAAGMGRRALDLLGWLFTWGVHVSHMSRGAALEGGPPSQRVHCDGPRHGADRAPRSLWCQRNVHSAFVPILVEKLEGDPPQPASPLVTPRRRQTAGMNCCFPSSCPPLRLRYCLFFNRIRCTAATKPLMQWATTLTNHSACSVPCFVSVGLRNLRYRTRGPRENSEPRLRHLGWPAHRRIPLTERVPVPD